MDSRPKKAVVIAGLLLLYLAVIAVAEIIGNAPVPLDTRQADRAESNFGNLAADAARKVGGAEIALVNASLFRPLVIPEGKIHSSQIEEALAYPEERIVVLPLTGDRVRAALERSLSLVPQPNKGFLQVSGLRVRFDSRRPPGNRVVEVIVDKNPLDPAKSYKLAVPKALARGGLGYFRIFNNLPFRDTGKTLLEAMTEYIASGLTKWKVEGRIKDLPQPGQE